MARLSATRSNLPLRSRPFYRSRQVEALPVRSSSRSSMRSPPPTERPEEGPGFRSGETWGLLLQLPRQSEEQRQRAIHADHGCIIEMAKGRADLVSFHSHWFVQHDL